MDVYFLWGNIMVTVDLITGFLGAGKTTFIKKYLHYLQHQGYKVRLIENEFGETNIDTQLLADERCEIEDLAGLCMCCVGKDAFIRMLQESAHSGCDRIVVEPSGIYDVDEFFEVLSLPQIHDCCQIGSILTIADPMGLSYMTEESEYLMFTQMLASGMVLLSKTQLMEKHKVEQSVECLHELMREKGCENGLMADVFTKDWNDLTEDDFEEIMDAGYARFVHDREEFIHGDVFQAVSYDLVMKNQKYLEQAIDNIFNSPACGVIYRIKGFTKDDQGVWYEVNCTSETYSVKVSDYHSGNLVVIGQYIRKDEILERFRG